MLSARLWRWLPVVFVLFTQPVLAELSPELLARYRQGQAHWPPFEVAEGVAAEPLGRLAPPPAPEWQSPALEALGRRLFFDPGLSRSGQIACASCHDPELGWGDGRRRPFGHDRQPGRRNTMTLLNAAYFESLFWDGRAWELESQALMPITNPEEMAADLDAAIERLNAVPGYRRDFARTLGSRVIAAPDLARALAAFERTIVSRPSRFDRFLAGRDVFTDREIEGLHLFRTRARCMNCHNGPLLSDGRFHNTGQALAGTRREDLGRYEVTGRAEDRGAFRTPSLRDLDYTAPWMHHGLFVNLYGTLAVYNLGMPQGRRDGQPPMSPLIRPLGLDRDELHALEAFLHTLSGRPQRVPPPSPYPSASQPRVSAAGEPPARSTHK